MLSDQFDDDNHLAIWTQGQLQEVKQSNIKSKSRMKNWPHIDAAGSEKYVVSFARTFQAENHLLSAPMNEKKNRRSTSLWRLIIGISGLTHKSHDTHFGFFHKPEYMPSL